MSNKGLIGAIEPQPMQTSWMTLPRAGKYYPSNIMTPLGVSQAAHANFLSWTPFLFPRSVSISAIGIWLSTVGSGGTGTCHLGLYESSPNVGEYRPGALMVDAGTLDLTATTGWREIAINQNLKANTIYWAAFVHGLTTVPSLWCAAGSAGVYASFNGLRWGYGSSWPTNNGSNESVTWSIAFSDGPLPANAPSVINETTLNGLYFPIPALKIGAVL